MHWLGRIARRTPSCLSCGNTAYARRLEGKSRPVSAAHSLAPSSLAMLVIDRGMASMGPNLSRVPARGLSIYFDIRVSLFDLGRFPRPDPHDRGAARAEAVKGGSASARQRRASPLTASSTTAHLAGRDDEVEGELACGARMDRATSFYSVGQRPRTMMQ